MGLRRHWKADRGGVGAGAEYGRTAGRTSRMVDAPACCVHTCTTVRFVYLCCATVTHE